MKTLFNSRLVRSMLLSFQALIAVVIIQEFSHIQQGEKSTYAAQAFANMENRVMIAGSERREKSRPKMNKKQSELLSLINDARRDRNIAPLRFSNTLSRAAQVHVEDIVRHNYELTHTGSDGSSVGDRASRAGYPNRYVGENVAAGTQSVKDTFEMWMDSPGHRDNILDPDYTEIGIGYYLNAPDTSYDHYWVNVFGNPNS
ncbi:MAG: hypothetical protein RLZZ511_4418 [Cyanobacteriota bacterium]